MKSHYNTRLAYDEAYKKGEIPKDLKRGVLS